MLRRCLDEIGETLSALEIERLVAARNATSVVRLEMVRISFELVEYIRQLDPDGRLLYVRLRRASPSVLERCV